MSEWEPSGGTIRLILGVRKGSSEERHWDRTASQHENYSCNGKSKRTGLHAKLPRPKIEIERKTRWGWREKREREIEGEAEAERAFKIWGKLCV